MAADFTEISLLFNQGNRLVLPAFGTFTGGAVVHPRPEDRIFVALRDQMIELSKMFQ